MAQTWHARRLRAARAEEVVRSTKRDDAIPFGFGGNKVRELEYAWRRRSKPEPIRWSPSGGVQSNHARATAAVAAKLGLRAHLIINGTPSEKPTDSARLDRLLGAEIEYIPSRLRARRGGARATCPSRDGRGRKPFWDSARRVHSTRRTRLQCARRWPEMIGQEITPDVIVTASSSGGTLAGLAAGIALHGVEVRLIGVSADDPAAEIESTVRTIVAGILPLVGANAALANDVRFSVDDRWIGEGYGVATDASREAQTLAARSEAVFVDHTYTAKALGALIGAVRAGEFSGDGRCCSGTRADRSGCSPDLFTPRGESSALRGRSPSPVRTAFRRRPAP